MQNRSLSCCILALVVLTSCATPAPTADAPATETAVAQGIYAALTAGAADAGSWASAVRGSDALCTTTIGGANLRSGPGTAFDPPLRGLPLGARLIPLAFSPTGDPEGRWLQVQLEEGASVGWVIADSISCNMAFDSLPIAAPPTHASPTHTPPPATAVTATAAPEATATPSPGAAIIDLPDGAHPNGIAVDPVRGRVFVSGRNTDRLYVIDGSGLEVIAEVPVGHQPFGVAYLDDYVHVANFGSGSVTVVDAESLRSLPHPGGTASKPETTVIHNELSQPTFIAADPLRNRVIVPLYHEQDFYFRYAYLYGVTSEGALGNWSSVLNLKPSCYGVAVLASRERAFIGNRDYAEIAAVDTISGNVVEAESLRDLDFSPFFIAVHENNRYLFVTHNAPGAPADAPDRLSVYFAYDEGEQPRLIRTIEAGDMGSAGGYVAIHPSASASPYDGTVWVSAGGKVTVWDPTLVTEMAVFDAEDGIGEHPYAIGLDAARRRAYVADSEADRVTVLSGW